MRQGAVIHRRDVSVGKDKSILTGTFNAKRVGIYVHYFVKQSCKKFNRTNRPTRMSGLYIVYHSYNISAYL